MTDAATTSWRAWQAALSDAALGVLHRALVNRDGRLQVCDPVRFGLAHGDGLDPLAVEKRFARVLWQADRAMNNRYEPVTEWLLAFDFGPFDAACEWLAGEVAAELDRRQRRGALEIKVC